MDKIIATVLGLSASALVSFGASNQFDLLFPDTLHTSEKGVASVTASADLSADSESDASEGLIVKADVGLNTNAQVAQPSPSPTVSPSPSPSASPTPTPTVAPQTGGVSAQPSPTPTVSLSPSPSPTQAPTTTQSGNTTASSEVQTKAEANVSVNLPVKVEVGSNGNLLGGVSLHLGL